MCCCNDMRNAWTRLNTKRVCKYTIYTPDDKILCAYIHLLERHRKLSKIQGILKFYFTRQNLLTVSRFKNFFTTRYGRLGERLACTQLIQCARLLKFLFIFFERLVNIFAIFLI